MAVICAPLVAQWKVTDTGIPRLASSKPNLSAPAPRRADGKPDLTGIWTQTPPKVRDPSAGLKAGEVSMQPWAQKLFDQRKTGELSAQDPDANCLPQGVPKINSAPAPFKIHEGEVAGQVWRESEGYDAGSIFNRAPSSSSVSKYSKPSGPWRTSRILCRNSLSMDSRRISSVLLLNTMRSR